MNKLKIFALLLLASGFSMANALSTSPMDTSGSQSYYDQLRDRFQAGTAVTYEELRGMMTGRCFEKWTPNAAVNDILLSYEHSDVSDPGPGFPKPSVIQYLGESVHLDGNNRALPSDYWDNYDAQKDPEELRTGVANTVLKGQYFPVVQDSSGNLTWMIDLEPNKRPDILYTIKKYQDEIVIEGTNLIANNTYYSDALGKVVKAVEAGPISYCYYFKKL
jgi:hypothetical protein